MYLLREESHLPSTRVGEIMGGKDHSSVLYGQRRFAEQLDDDPSLRHLIAAMAHLTLHRVERVVFRRTGLDSPLGLWKSPYFLWKNYRDCGKVQTPSGSRSVYSTPTANLSTSFTTKARTSREYSTTAAI